MSIILSKDIYDVSTFLIVELGHSTRKNTGLTQQNQTQIFMNSSLSCWKLFSFSFIPLSSLQIFDTHQSPIITPKTI